MEEFGNDDKVLVKHEEETHEFKRSQVASDRVMHIGNGTPPTEVVEFLQSRGYEVIVGEEVISSPVEIPYNNSEVEEVLGVDPYDDRFEQFRYIVEYGLSIEFEVDTEGDVFVTSIEEEELDEKVNIS